MAQPNSDLASNSNLVPSVTMSGKPGANRVKNPAKQMAGSLLHSSKRKHSDVDTQSPDSNAGTPDLMAAEDPQSENSKKLRQIRQSTTNIVSTIPLSETNPVFIDVDGRAIKYTHSTTSSKADEISLFEGLRPYSLRIRDGISDDQWDTDLSAELLKGLSLYDQKDLFPTFVKNDGHLRVRAQKTADQKYKDMKAVVKALKSIERGGIEFQALLKNDPNHFPFGENEELSKMGVVKALLGAHVKPSKPQGEYGDELQGHMIMFMTAAEKMRRELTTYHYAQQKIKGITALTPPFAIFTPRVFAIFTPLGLD